MAELEETSELTGEYIHVSSRTASGVSCRRSTNSTESTGIDFGKTEVSEILCIVYIVGRLAA